MEEEIILTPWNELTEDQQFDILERGASDQNNTKIPSNKWATTSFYINKRTGKVLNGSEVNEWLNKDKQPEKVTYKIASEDPTIQNQQNRFDTYSANLAGMDKQIGKGFGNNQYLKLAGYLLGGSAAATVGSYALPALWPYIGDSVMTGLDVYGGYEGLLGHNGLLTDNGIKKTKRLFQQGDYEGAAYSATGDVLNTLLLPFGVKGVNKIFNTGVKVGDDLYSVGRNGVIPTINKTNAAQADLINTFNQSIKKTTLPNQYISTDKVRMPNLRLEPVDFKKDWRDFMEPTHIYADNTSRADGTLIETGMFNNQPGNIVSGYIRPTEQGIENGVEYYKYSQNGRDYGIYINNKDNSILVETPERLKAINTTPETFDEDYKAAQDIILNSRDNFIESLPDEDIKSIVRSDRIQSSNEIQDLDYSVDPLVNIVGNQALKDIDEIYGSDSYIKRYAKLIEKKKPKKLTNEEIEEIRNEIIPDIKDIHSRAKPKIYSEANSRNLGKSWGNYNRDGVWTPTYGINSNAEVLDDWDYTIFHEFGHNIWRDPTTNFSKKLRDHNTEVVKEIFNTDDYLTDYGKVMTKKYVEYLKDPNELRQRIMEAIRYGIKHNILNPEQIYNSCNVSGFSIVKDCFKKDLVVKLLGSMLAATPLLINNNQK